MLEQSQLLSDSHLVMEHVRRLKRLARQRPVGRQFQRRVRELEQAASRMELQVKAQLVCTWRAQSHRVDPVGETHGHNSASC